MSLFVEILLDSNISALSPTTTLFYSTNLFYSFNNPTYKSSSKQISTLLDEKPNDLICFNSTNPYFLYK